MKKIGTADSRRIDTTKETELAYWMITLRVDRSKLLEAIQCVGNLIDDVRAYVRLDAKAAVGKRKPTDADTTLRELA